MIAENPAAALAISPRVRKPPSHVIQKKTDARTTATATPKASARALSRIDFHQGRRPVIERRIRQLPVLSSPRKRGLDANCDCVPAFCLRQCFATAGMTKRG